MLDKTESMKWIPTNKVLPKKNVRVLLFTTSGICIGSLTEYSWQYQDYMCHYLGTNADVTHWMPLPDEPLCEEELTNENRDD